MDKIDFQEKVLGGIFGGIAIIAAIAEMFINGIDAASIVGAIKDVFGTLIVIVLFITFIRQLPKKPKNITERLEKSIEDWGNDNAPLIFKTVGYEVAKDSAYSQGFVLLQNPRTYPQLADISPASPNWIDYAQYKSPKRLTGKFLDMPSYDTMTHSKFDVLFVMEQKHFQDMDIDNIIEDIIKAVNQKFNGKAWAARVGKSAKFTIHYNRIVTTDDIELFRDSLDFVLSLVKVVA